MKIRLKKLTLTNFKGIRSFTVVFNDTTNISGENATGKTTLKDAFLWIFFGKDSSDRKDFEIKTLDENNNPFHNLDHVVEAVIDLDGEEIAIRREFREKWVKKRGEKESVFTGHETAFFWNDVPMKEGEYQAKVASVFNENIFKLITNTDYFNSLKWQDRRGVLMQLAGNISNDEVFASLNITGDYSALKAALNQKKTVDEFRKEIGAKKKKIKDELDLIPTRIEESNRSLPEQKDYSAIEKLITEATSDLESVEGLLMNKTKAQKEYQKKISEKIMEVGTLQSQMQRIEFSEKNAVADKKRTREQLIMDKKRDLRTKQDEKARLLTDYNNESNRKNKALELKTELTKKWEDINKEELKFNENEFSCPACKRSYEATDIEAKKKELVTNFNTDKTRRLADVTDRGKKVAEDIKVIEASISNLMAKGTGLKAEVEVLEKDINILEQENIRISGNEDTEVKQAIASNTEYQGISQMITLRNEEINTPFPEDNNTELVSRKKAIQITIDQWNKELAGKEQREKILARITELKEQESTMAQELASLEGTEFSIDQFIKAKMDMLETRINGRFKLVQFKMFEQQINGGQVEACTTLINGVPYSDANTAARIQAGLDIINTLSDHYDTYGPIWVDNRESVINLPETKSQLINLIVSEKHKKLTVEKASQMAMV